MMSGCSFRSKLSRVCATVLAVSCLYVLGVSTGLPAASAAFTSQTWQLTTYDAQGMTTEGSVEQDGNVITLETNGWNVWGNGDGFTFVSQSYESLYEECSSITITGIIDDIAGAENTNAAAGLMFRDQLDAGSKNVMLRMQNGSLLLTYRQEDSQGTSYKRGAALTLPLEVKLVRQGSTFTGYYKQNGEWILSNYVNVDMGAEVEAGIAGYSAAANPITAQFRDVDIVADNYYSPPDDNYVDAEPIPTGMLLRDRFEDGSATNGPAAITSPVWSGIKLACIEQETDGNHVWRRNGANGAAYAGDRTWTDYEASMDVRFEPGSEGKNVAQLLVRGKDTAIYGAFYYAIGFSGGNKLVLEKSFRNSVKLMDQVGIDSVLDGQWRTIKAKVLDNVIEVYLDGTLKMQYTDESLPNLRGAVGIRTEDSRAAIDNMIVMKIDDPLGGDYDNEVGGNFDKPAPTE